MKKFDQLLQDLGFRTSASRDAQEAFVRHLQRVAIAPSGKIHPFPIPEKKSDLPSENFQPEFDPQILGTAIKK